MLFRSGGTEAIREFLMQMPSDCPGILIAQHMPEGFTSSFAKRLDSLCRISVSEAQGNERVLPDTGPTFLSIARSPERTRAYVTGWLMNPHPPMPNLSLTVREIADLAAYIETLRVQP